MIAPAHNSPWQSGDPVWVVDTSGDCVRLVAGEWLDLYLQRTRSGEIAVFYKVLVSADQFVFALPAAVKGRRPSRLPTGRLFQRRLSMTNKEMRERVQRRFPTLPPKWAEEVADFALAQCEECQEQITLLEAQLVKVREEAQVS